MGFAVDDVGFLAEMMGFNSRWASQIDGFLGHSELDMTATVVDGRPS